jgi:hypothetical protein
MGWRKVVTFVGENSLMGTLDRSFSRCGINGEADAKVLKLQSVKYFYRI